MSKILNTLYMGCGGHADSSSLNEYESSGKWCAEPKCDGDWAVVRSIFKEQRFHSRSGNLLAVSFPLLPEGTSIVGELGIGQQSAIERQKIIGHDFIDVFDILKVDGKDVSNLCGAERRKILEKVYETWSDEVRKYFLLIPRWYDNFKKHFDESDEGLVLKRLDSGPYIPNSRSADWVKVKRVLTVDMVVMNYKLTGAVTLAGSNNGQGAAKCLTCGVYKDGSLIELVDVGSFDHKTKKDVVANWNKYKGRVVEIECYKVFKSGSLRHPSLKGFRDDKLAKECTWETLIPLMKIGKKN